MGACSHCSQPAGLLRSVHKECEQQHAAAQAAIQRAVVQFIMHQADAGQVRSMVLPLARQGFVRTSELDGLMVEGWRQAVDACLEDGLLTAAEEAALVNFAEKTGLMPNISRLPAYGLLAKAAQLRDLGEGKIQSRMTFNGPTGLNLQKNEVLIWAFPGTEYLEDRERREMVGVSHGVSVRIVKGVYYRVGAFKVRPVGRQERVSLGVGTLDVTTRHIYFSGPQKSLRIPYSKIVSYEQYSDGIGLMRDAATAKPQVFVTNDGWFAFNLINLVSQL